MSFANESFVDTYETRVTVRKIHADDTHVQLLLTYADGTEQTSYGFTDADFARFADSVSRLAEKLA